MDHRIVTLIHVLGFYSLAFVFATSFYLLNGYPSETPFLPFVEGVSMMATFSLYILFGLVTGKIKDDFLKILLWVYLGIAITLAAIVPSSILIIGGFIFGLPAIPLGMLTLGLQTPSIVLIALAGAVGLLLWSYNLQVKKQPGLLQ